MQMAQSLSLTVSILKAIFIDQSGYSSVTECTLLQAIRPALNNFCVGFTSMVGAQATKG